MNMDRTSTEWTITATRISSKSYADILFEEKAVRISGELMCSCFLADPYEMFWLAKEDWDRLPWILLPKKRQNLLSESERQAVMDAVSSFRKGKKDSIQFLTKELEDRAFALAEQIKTKQLSERKAICMLRKEFPNFMKQFYHNMIMYSMVGVKRYGRDEIRKANTDATNNCKDVYLNELELILPEYERKLSSCLEPQLNGAHVKCENNGCDHYDACIVLEDRTVKFACFRVECNKSEEKISLNRIAVHESLRRRKIGKTLISAIEEAAKRSGYKYLSVIPGGYSFPGNTKDDTYLIDRYGKHFENCEITDKDREAFYRSCGFTALEGNEYGAMWKPIN